MTAMVGHQIAMCRALARIREDVNPTITTLKTKIDEFASSKDRFNSNLPPNIRMTAIDIALAVLTAPENEVFELAAELDFWAVMDGFARYEQEVNGKLLQNHQNLRIELLRRYPFDEVQRITNKSLRQAVASRWSRIQLARDLGYRAGRVKEITLRSDFQAGNDLCWQAVLELY